jgi:hypothetical protein
VTPIAIDLDIGNTLQAVSGILARRDSERATVWDSLAYHLEAVSFAVGDLDRMYFSILAEVQNVFAEPKPSHESIETVIARATIYCTDGRLALRLDEWQGLIEGAAFNRELKHRKYRTLVSTLRSIDDPLKRYIQRLYHLQSSVSDPINSAQTDDATEPVPDDRVWNLRTVLLLLKSIAVHVPDDELMEGATDPIEACEQAMRNYDRALSLSLVHLIGYARQDLAMETL